MALFRPKDIAAYIVLIGIVLLKLNGLNGGLDTAGALILGYYFAKRVNHEDKGL